jgi:hypothetical protein
MQIKRISFTALYHPAPLGQELAQSEAEDGPPAPSLAELGGELPGQLSYGFELVPLQVYGNLF